MELKEVKQLAKQLMTKWGCDDCKFAWNNRRRALGLVKWNRITGTKELQLSRYFALANDFNEVKDVILHEIAHILAGPDQGHNAVWKAACRKVGARPERLNRTAKTAYKYQLKCDCGCGTVAGGFFSKPRKDYTNYRLTSCSTSTGLRVVEAYK